MVEIKDILDRLNNGASIDELANEFASKLTEANTQYENSKKEKDSKREDMQQILDLMHDFCINHYCESNDDIDVTHEIFKQFTADKIIETIESMSHDVNMLCNLNQMLPKEETTDDIISKWLKSVNLA